MAIRHARHENIVDELTAFAQQLADGKKQKRGTDVVTDLMDRVEAYKMPGDVKSEVVNQVVEKLLEKTKDKLPESVAQDLQTLVDSDMLQPLMDTVVRVSKGLVMRAGKRVAGCFSCLGC